MTKRCDHCGKLISCKVDVCPNCINDVMKGGKNKNGGKNNIKDKHKKRER